MKNPQRFSTTMGDLESLVHVHDDGTHSLSLVQWRRQPEARFSTTSYHLTRADLVKLHKMIGQALRRSAAQPDRTVQMPEDIPRGTP